MNRNESTSTPNTFKKYQISAGQGIADGHVLGEVVVLRNTTTPPMRVHGGFLVAVTPAIPYFTLFGAAHPLGDNEWTASFFRLLRLSGLVVMVQPLGHGLCLLFIEHAIFVFV